jgi:HEAT repeat protein
MTSLDETRRELDKDELDYPALARQLGPDVLPDLHALVAEDEPRIASKAAYLAGVIAGPTSEVVVALAAISRHDAVRVAAAATLPTLPTEHAATIAERLLSDPDTGVRARALKSAARIDEATVTARVKTMAAEDPEPDVRDLAGDIAARRPG